MPELTIHIEDSFYEREERCNYVIEKNVKKLWAVQLDLLGVLRRVCQNHNIKYYACAGTLLGAARHNGYIPWDDDLDVMMFRSDYDKLCEIASMGEFTEPYFFQTEYTDPGTLRGHAQLRNSSTTGIIKSEFQGHYSFNQGVFIDIFPIDNVPDSTEERIEFLSALNVMKSKMMRYANLTYWYSGNLSTGITNSVKKVLHPITYSIEKKLHLLRAMYSKYEKMMKRYNNVDTQFVGITALSQHGDRFMWPKEVFKGKDKVLSFEMFDILAPNNYAATLKLSYGDWETPIKSAAVHGSLIFNTDISYTDFLEKMK